MAQCTGCHRAKPMDGFKTCFICRDLDRIYRATWVWPRKARFPALPPLGTGVNQIAHCGRFHPVITLPFQCPTCGKTPEQFLVKEVA